MNNKNPVRLIRLVNGDNIIAEMIAMDGGYTLRNPIAVVPDADLGVKLRKKQTIVMYAYLPSTLIDGGDIDIKHEHILFTSAVLGPIEEYYTGFASKLYDEDSKPTAVEDATSEFVGTASNDDTGVSLVEPVKDTSGNTLQDLMNLLDPDNKNKIN